MPRGAPSSPTQEEVGPPVCQAPCGLVDSGPWTQKATVYLALYVHDGLKPQILDQKCKTAVSNIPSTQKTLKKLRTRRSAPGSWGSAGASLTVCVSQKGERRGWVALSLTPPPSLMSPARGRMLHCSPFTQLFNSPWLSRDGDGAICTTWAS